MNRYPLWKYLLILAVLVVGVIYALPNVYGTDPAVQISPTGRAEITEPLAGQVKSLVEGKGIPVKAVERLPDGLLLRFEGVEDQLKAAQVIQAGLGGDYVAAVNLAPATPAWLEALGARPMYLGLDLRGGLHFLLEVDTDSVVEQALEGFAGEVRDRLRKKKIRYLAVRQKKAGLVIRFRDAATRDKAMGALRRIQELSLAEDEDDRGPVIRAAITPQHLKEIKKLAIQQNVATLRNRANELGVAEPVIQQQGENRIVVQLPGIQDSAQAKRILGATATLEFRLVDMEHDAREAADTGRVPLGARLYYEKDGTPILLKRRVITTGKHITHATSGFDSQSGTPAVFINLDGPGGDAMARTTKKNLKKLMAVVFIEYKPVAREVDGEIRTVLEKKETVINVATIQGVFSKRFQITGLDSPREAHDLALLLRAGALAAPIRFVEERTIGPSLGKENIAQGTKSVMVGMLLVLVFMAVWYKAFGVVADLALVVNLVLIVAALSLFQATLTLPGIAGIVLTVGMAVDANVLIFERIREELRNGNTPQASIHAGYAKALETIADANITTLIAAVVLFIFGTGPIKGFAVTLSIGIVTSMFTAIMGTRAVINLAVGGRRIKRLWI